jgi:hypothetical protein
MKEAWDFYISLFTHENIAIRLGAYGATLATLTFLLTWILKPLYYKFRRKTGKIKVKHAIQQQLQTYGLGSMSAIDPLFTAIITNTGDQVKYVSAINVKTSKKLNGYDMFSAPNINKTFPAKLESGQQFKHEFSISALTQDVFSKLPPSTKVQFLVYDTTGKKYYSKKVKAEQLTMQLDVAYGLNAKR